MYIDHFGWLENVSKQKWQLFILDCLRGDQLRFSEIGAMIRQTNPTFSDGTLTRCLKRLRVRGMVARAPSDKATHAWRLTVDGLHEARRLRAVLEALEKYETATDAPQAPSTTDPDAAAPSDTTGAEQSGVETTDGEHSGP